MLTALSLLTALSVQSAPPAPPTPPAHPQAQTRVMVMGGPGGEGHGSLDKDGDGQITRDEFSAPLNDAFGRLDTNGDGRLSDEEMKAGHHGPGGEGNTFFMRHPSPGGPGGENHRVFMRHPGGPEGPGPHRFEVRRETVNGEETVRVFTQGENGEMVEVEGGVEGLNLPDGAHVRMMQGGGEHDVVIVNQGGPGGEMMRHPMPGGDGRMMVFEMAEGGPGEHRVEVRRMAPGAEGHGGPGAPRVMMHRMGGPEGHGPGDMDKDGDGRVTEDEFLAPMREAFQRMDADRSGALEASENSGNRRVMINRSEERRSGE